MRATNGYATHGPDSRLEPFSFERRDPGPDDVLIQILYCGICHADIHHARNDWQTANYPMVPGHEIIGRVGGVGSNVASFKEGDLAGVGCFVDSCRECESCGHGMEQYCSGPAVWTYNTVERDGKTRTFGGYSSEIVVDHNYVLRVPPGLDLAATAPLLCAGVTTYSPLKHFGISKGDCVGVVGLGGLGHMAVKLAASMGADVTVLSTSTSKEDDARRLGASDFIITKGMNPTPLSNRFNLVIDTVSAPHHLKPYIGMLNRDGTMVLLGIPPSPAPVSAGPLIVARRRLAGSLIGSIRETQETLDYCGANGITSDVEVIAIVDVNEAYERILKGDVRYRFVIDLKTLVSGAKPLPKLP